MHNKRNSYGVCGVSFATFLILLTCLANAQDFPKQRQSPTQLPAKEKTWIFIMAGQSNMAGRGVVAPEDTLPNPRILAINALNELIIAKEPLHFYEPALTGLDCGVSFAREITRREPSITILLVPVAVGGSSSGQWLGDSLHRGVRLLTNFRDRVEATKKYGTIKAILWHQGEADSESGLIPDYDFRLGKLFSAFREFCGDATLPVLIGKLGSFSDNQTNWDLINQSIRRYATRDKNAFVVETKDLRSKDDKIHFNAEGQRIMGRRMAEMYLQKAKR